MHISTLQLNATTSITKTNIYLLYVKYSDIFYPILVHFKKWESYNSLLGCIS